MSNYDLQQHQIKVYKITCDCPVLYNTKAQIFLKANVYTNVSKKLKLFKCLVLRLMFQHVMDTRL